MTAATVAHLPADTVTAIADLFLQGRRVSEVIAHGLTRAGGWRKPDVIDVLNARGWRLDSDGRIPRQHRTGTPETTLPGGCTPAPGRVASWPEKGAVTVPRTSSGRQQVAALLEQESRLAVVKPTVARPQPPEPKPAMAAAARNAAADELTARVTGLLDRHPEPQAATATPTVLADAVVTPQEAREAFGLPGADALLARAYDSPSRAVVAAADKVRAALDELRRLLDADEEVAKVRARIAELDAERRDLAARLEELQTGGAPSASTPPLEVPGDAPSPVAPKPAAAKPAVTGKAKKGADSTTPIKHGTWGGFMQHRVRGEQACAACDTAREQTMAARAAKRAGR